MNQLEQKMKIQKEIDDLEATLKFEKIELGYLKRALDDAEYEYDEQEFFVGEIKHKIKELNSQIGVIMQGQLSIEDYDL